MKKLIFLYILAAIFLILPVYANANESDKLAKLAQSCESSQHYQDCVRGKFFNNLK
jgi:hypothetical protein